MKINLKENKHGWIVRSGQEHITYDRPHSKKIKSQLQKSVHLTEVCLRKIDIPD